LYSDFLGRAVGVVSRLPRQEGREVWERSSAIVLNLPPPAQFVVVRCRLSVASCRRSRSSTGNRELKRLACTMLRCCAPGRDRKKPIPTDFIRKCLRSPKAGPSEAMIVPGHHAEGYARAAKDLSSRETDSSVVG